MPGTYLHSGGGGERIRSSKPASAMQLIQRLTWTTQDDNKIDDDHDDHDDHDNDDKYCASD